jgi:hypothetical protein
MLVIVHNVVERIGREVVARAEIQKFTEREATQIIGLHDTVQLGIFFLQSHDGRTGEHNLQTGIAIVAHAQFVTPIGVLEHLVDEQHTSATLLKLACKVGNASALEIEIVQVDVEARTVRAKTLLGILQKESGFSYTTCTLDAYHAVIPIYLVHQIATDKSTADVLNQITMCTIKDFHFFALNLKVC